MGRHLGTKEGREKKKKLLFRLLCLPPLHSWSPEQTLHPRVHLVMVTSDDCTWFFFLFEQVTVEHCFKWVKRQV